MATTIPAAAPHTGATATARPLHLANPLMKGDDVKEAQRLLNKHGFPCGDVDGEFGPATAAATANAKWELGYPEPNVDQVFGLRLRAFLDGSEQLPADFANRQKARRQTALGDKHIRGKIVEYARWGCRHEPQIHYSHQRPVDGLSTPMKLPLETDCSGFVTDCYRWAGAPDPSGKSYDGESFTGFMIAAGRHIAKAAVQPGDLIVFGGPADKQHVCIVVEPGADPRVVSHGQEKGPIETTTSVEIRAHAGQPIFWLAYLR